MSKIGRAVKWCIGVGVVAGLAFACVRAVQINTQPQNLTQATAAFENGQFLRALELAHQQLRDNPNSVETLKIAGESAMRLGDSQQALKYFQLLLALPDQQTPALWSTVGNLHMTGLQTVEAEVAFRRALELNPQSVGAARGLARLLGFQGRMRESLPLRYLLLSRGRFTFEDLFVLALPKTVIRSPESERFAQAMANDPVMKFSDAAEMIRQGQYLAAERLLRRLMALAPYHLEAQAEMGKLLLLRNAPPEELRQWQAQLIPAARQYAGIWVVAGQLAEDQNEHQAAARCYWEALRLDPNLKEACYALAHLLSDQGKTEPAKILLQRHHQLERLAAVADRLAGDQDNHQEMRLAAQMLEELGRWREANGWYRTIEQQAPQLAWAKEGLARTAQRFSKDDPRPVAANLDPAKIVDLSKYPLPKDIAPQEMGRATKQVQAPVRHPPSQVVFEDVAAPSGIRFQFFNSEDLSTPGRRMFEFTGGGAAVLDYDGDQWPDLYLTQGCRWRPDPEQTEHKDRLYRNLGGVDREGRIQFEDVTEAANLGDNRYSQGVAVGDINNDGFPDLLVANIGGNRLYQNDGDGRFHEVPDKFFGAAGLSGIRWTTSCLIADLNGDGLPDLYEANYLQGSGVFDTMCQRGNHQGICTPLTFPAQRDVFYLNLGDGRFLEQTRQAGFAIDPGRGLGVVAADFDGSGKLALFVANDMTANFFFVNSQPRGKPPRFFNEAVVAGLAFDGHGRAQACMGIAVDDANGDGILDMSVTNFFNEPNTFYQGGPQRMFSDETRRAALFAPTLPMLGFGTQFLDGELDGLPDLVVANGHIDDFTYEGAGYQMRPQYFRNLGQTFEEVTGEPLGEYFQRKLLGRGLALIDFNRDGREDVVVSHLDAPVVLLMNTTEKVGRFLAVRLCGASCERDAHGTTVTVTSGAKKWVRQLTAGSGYHASNQKQLVFGLGESAVPAKPDAQQSLQVEVAWPSGRKQSFGGIAANQQILLVEGHSEVYHQNPHSAYSNE